jgi:hypothetical protein
MRRARRSGAWARGSVALLVLSACSSKALTLDGAARVDGAGDDVSAEAGAPDADAGGGRCGRTFDRAAIAIHFPGGGTLSCINVSMDAAVTPPRSWIGRVTASDATSLTVALADTCDGDAACAPRLLRIEAQAPGLDLTAFPREEVQVRASVTRFRACQQALEITTTAGRLLLVVVDGAGPFDTGSPYGVERIRLGCSSEKGCGSVPPDDYALEFTGLTGPPPLRVHMGETGPGTNGESSLRVRNLRSFQSEACDDYWNFAYTISPSP